MTDASGDFLLYTGVEGTVRPSDKRMPMHVLIADEMPAVQAALRVLLEQQPGVKVVGEAADAEELLAQAESTRPDVVLLGWDLQARATADLLSALHRLCPASYVIALGSRPDARRAALYAGADAFVSKADPPERLLAAINEYIQD
jgi:DNA-binding NarL/FixJ family response regulator